MQFVSFGFLIFFPIVTLINNIIPKNYRYIWLLVTSCVFYLGIDVRAFAVLIILVLLTYGVGIWLERADARGTSAKKAVFAAGIIICVLSLFIFRTNSIIGAVGISFYMLKAIGYLIDIYRGKTAAEKNVAKYALFVSFFPQIISGPIERAGNMLPQFDEPTALDFERLRDGLLQMLWGYFLKLVVADRLAIFVNSVYSGNAYDGGIVLIGTVFYTFEIYCDFAGYSHIAIGAARLLGIDVMKNFDSPYLSGSVAEFWRRWHISLSSWLRDYVYIPLGGNRRGTLRKFLNILIVFAVSGLWHGSALTFLVWGLLHAVYEIIGAALQPVRNRLVNALKIDRESFSHRLLKILVTFMLVSYAWIFFRAETLSQAVTIIGKTFEFTPWVLGDGSLYKLGLDSANFTLAAIGIMLTIAADIFNYHGIIIRQKLMESGLWLRWMVVISGIIIVLVCGIWGPGYDAASFIYQQF